MHINAQRIQTWLPIPLERDKMKEWTRERAPWLAVGILAFSLIGKLIYWRWSLVPTIQSVVGGVEAPKKLVEQSHEFDRAEVIQVTDGIYVAVGFALSNSVLVEGEDGAIIVDTTESISSGKEVLRAFRKVTKLPITDIIYTHHHADHTQGTAAFVENPKYPPNVWAHFTVMDNIDKLRRVGHVLIPRSLRQFGVLLPDGAHINSGIGPSLKFDKTSHTNIMPPNKLLYGDVNDYKIAGLDVRFLHVPGETTDQMAVYIPSKRALLCADDFYKAFPSLYAIRGTYPRNVLQWIRSIDKMLDMNAHYLIPSHTRPIIGASEIRAEMTSYRDAIQYVHDQTVRYMNQGLHPNDIAQKIKLPLSLTSNPYLYELYGTVEWSVRSIFSEYLGWFSGFAEDLSPLGSREKAERMRKLSGGISSLCDAAQGALDEKDDQWALELSSHVLVLDPDHSMARDIRREALRSLASQQVSANGRNYYLTVALEDYHLISARTDKHAINNVLHTFNAREIFEQMQYRLMPERCAIAESVVVLFFHDTNETFTLNIRNGILKVDHHDSDEFNVKVNLNVHIFKELILGKRSPFTAYANGYIKVEGGVNELSGFMNCFER